VKGKISFAGGGEEGSLAGMSVDEAAIAEAERAGHDLSLVDCNLRLSVEDRLMQHDAALEVVQEFRRAGTAFYAQTPSPAPATR